MITPNNQRTASAEPPKPRVVIAGVGLLTPLGSSAWETFVAMRRGRCATDRARFLHPHVDAVELVRSLGMVSLTQRTATDPAVELAERAAREAAAEAGVSLRDLPTFLGTGKGATGMGNDGCGMWDRGSGMSKWAASSSSSCSDIPDPTSPIPHHPFHPLGPHGYFNHHLVRRTGIRLRTHTVAACASALIALDQARRFLAYTPRSRRPTPYCLVLTAEASLSPLYIHTYRRLGVLAPLTREGYRQRPFDEQRQGFILTETGAAVLLRRLEPDEPVPAGTVELIATATATEGYDLIRPNPQMAALRRVAQQLFQNRQPPDVIHAHAPGTPDHDPAEFAAYRSVLGARQSTATAADGCGIGDVGSGMSEQAPAPCGVPDSTSHIPHLYAHKGALGHTLGASGLVALVLAHLCARAKQLPPMPWLQNPIAPELRPTSHTLRPDSTHAVFAAGFAGHTAGALIRRQT